VIRVIRIVADYDHVARSQLGPLRVVDTNDVGHFGVLGRARVIEEIASRVG